MKKSILFVLLAALLLTMVCGAYAEDIVVLYTNDVHCGYGADPDAETLGYTTVAWAKKYYQEKTPYVALVDNGDAIQGDVIGAVSKGEYIIDFMNLAGYDVAILGNHEFDYGMDQIAALAEKAEFPYVDCNITYSGSGENKLSFLKPYVIKEFGEKKVAFIGVATPNSIATSTPTFFQEDGEFVYGFSAGEKGAVLYNAVQAAVDAAREEGADYVILLTHLGIEEGDAPYRSIDVIANTNGVNACLDGHSHSVIEQDMVANKDGEEVLLSSTGTKFVHLGKLTIAEDGTFSSQLLEAGMGHDEDFDDAAEDIVEDYEEKVNEVVAGTDIPLYITDADGVRMIRSRETNLGDLVADAYRTIGNADIALVNGGGIRANIAAGDITYANIIAVHPFGNQLTVVKATGQQVIDALEWTSRSTQAEYKDADGKALGENGGFLQVSGLKYTIDTTVESPCIADENNLFFGMIEDAPYRVTDVMVEKDGEWVAIDPEGEYLVASHNYLLKEGGDGTNMFMNDELVIDTGMSDYQIVISYITENLEGQCGAYAEPAGRITVK